MMSVTSAVLSGGMLRYWTTMSSTMPAHYSSPLFSLEYMPCNVVFGGEHKLYSAGTENNLKHAALKAGITGVFTSHA